jgi:hypothetical protein
MVLLPALCLCYGTTRHAHDKIIIPEDCADVHCRLLFVDLGHLTVDTRSASSTRPIPSLSPVNSMVPAPQSQPAATAPAAITAPRLPLVPIPRRASNVSPLPQATRRDSLGGSFGVLPDDTDDALSREMSVNNDRFVTPPSSPTPSTFSAFSAVESFDAVPASTGSESASAAPSSSCADMKNADGPSPGEACKGELPYDRFDVDLRDVQVCCCHIYTCCCFSFFMLSLVIILRYSWAHIQTSGDMPSTSPRARYTSSTGSQCTAISPARAARNC